MTLSRDAAYRAVMRVKVGREIRLVKALRHRIGTRFSCKCEECRAIVQVCKLADERLARILTDSLTYELHKRAGR